MSLKSISSDNFTNDLRIILVEEKKFFSNSLHFERNVFVRNKTFLTTDTASPPIVGNLTIKCHHITFFQRKFPVRSCYEIKLRCRLQILGIWNQSFHETSTEEHELSGYKVGQNHWKFLGIQPCFASSTKWVFIWKFNENISWCNILKKIQMKNNDYIIYIYIIYIWW